LSEEINPNPREENALKCSLDWCAYYHEELIEASQFLRDTPECGEIFLTNDVEVRRTSYQLVNR
jgi:hypothetical protein